MAPPLRLCEKWALLFRRRFSPRRKDAKTQRTNAHYHGAIYFSKTISLSLSSAILFDLPRPPQRSPGLRPGVLAVFQNLRAIYKHVFHPDGELMRMLEGGAVCEARRRPCAR